MPGAPCPPPLLLEVAAPKVEGGIDQELLTLHAGGPEIDLLGMAKEPGPLVVEGKDPILEPSHLEGDVELAALLAHLGAGGCGLQ